MILAVDFGSTYFKAMVHETGAGCLGEGSARLEYVDVGEGRVEFRIEAAREACRKAIGEALTAAAVSPVAIGGVGITSQAQTFALFDSRGEARTHFISWLDVRAQAASAALAERLRGEDVFSHTGLPSMSASLLAAKLFHLREREPGLVDAGSSVVDLVSFFAREFAGRGVVDNNLAAMSGLYSLRDNGWWGRMLEVCGISAAQLPEVSGIGERAATTGKGAAAYALPEGVGVVLAGNDQTAGAYGAGLHMGGGILVTLGTAAVVYEVADKPLPKMATAMSGPYPHGLHYRLLAEDCCGNVIDWACRQIRGAESYAHFFALAEGAAPGSNDLRFVPDARGAKGQWVGRSEDHGSEDLARAVLEGVSAHVAGMANRLTGRREATRVLVAGGGSRSRLWREILEAALGRETELANAAPALGAALLAGEALGK